MSDKQPTIARIEVRTTPEHREELVKFAEVNNMNLSESAVVLLQQGVKAFEKAKEPNQVSMFSGTPEFTNVNAWLDAHFNTVAQVTPPLVEDRETLTMYFQWRLLSSAAHAYDQTTGTRLREMECLLLSHYFTQDEVEQWVKWEAIIQESLYGENKDKDAAEMGLTKQHQLFEKVANDIKVGARKLNVVNVFVDINMTGYNQ